MKKVRKGKLTTRPQGRIQELNRSLLGEGPYVDKSTGNTFMVVNGKRIYNG